MKNKILISARNISGRTGASKIILFQAQFLAENGWTVFLVANKLPGKLDNPKIKCLKLPTIGFSKFSKRVWFSRLCDFVISIVKPSFVYGHGDTMSQDFLALHNCIFLASEVGEGKVLSAKNDVGEFHKKMLLGGNYRRIIANSFLMKDDLVRRYGIKNESIDVLYPGYSPSEYNSLKRVEARENILKKFDLSEESVLVGFVASGDFRKRKLDILIPAFSKASLPPLTYLVVVGSDKSINKYKILAKKHGVESRVIWAGFQEKTHPYMKAFDLFVQPASHEEFGMTVLEAMASGTAVIVSNGVGSSELFCGVATENVLNAPVKIEELVISLEKNINDLEFRKRVANTLEEISHKYSWDKNFSNLLEIFQKV